MAVCAAISQVCLADAPGDVLFFSAVKDEGMRGVVRLGALTIDSDIELPISLVHQVQFSIHGVISHFVITPLDTYIVEDAEDESKLVWHTPAGEIVSIEKSLIGARMVRGISVYTNGNRVELTFTSGLKFTYTAGLLDRIDLPSGRVITAQRAANGEQLLMLGNETVLSSVPSPGGLSIETTGAASRKYHVDFNENDQIVKFNSGTLDGKIEYDKTYLLQGIELSNGQRMRFVHRRPNIWEYERFSRASDFDWKVEHVN